MHVFLVQPAMLRIYLGERNEWHSQKVLREEVESLM